MEYKKDSSIIDLITSDEDVTELKKQFDHFYVLSDENPEKEQAFDQYMDCCSKKADNAVSDIEKRTSEILFSYSKEKSALLDWI